jgi:hypothetical protein
MLADAIVLLMEENRFESVGPYTDASPESRMLWGVREEIINRIGSLRFKEGAKAFIARLKLKYPQYGAKSDMPQLLDGTVTLHPNTQDFAAWHILDGSTAFSCTEFDFPGDDSVTRFLNNLRQGFP